MAINLEKMLRDLQTGDEDIKVLALGTLLQYDFTPLASQRETLMRIRALLENSPDSFSGDMGFLYRQVLEKLRDSPMLVVQRDDGGPSDYDRGPDGLPEGRGHGGRAEPAPAAGALSESPAGASAGEAVSQDTGAGEQSFRSDDAAGLLAVNEPGRRIEALMKIKNEQLRGARDEVLELLVRSKDERVVASCISALGAIGEKSDVLRLRPYLGHPDGRVRANTVEAIEKIGTPLQVLIFLSPYTRDYNKRVRHNALRALARLGRHRILQLLQALLKQPNVNLKGNAVYVLENFQGEDALAVARLALQDESEFIRMETLNLLARRRGEGVRELIASCLQSPSQSVRNLAATILKNFDEGTTPPRRRVDLEGLGRFLDPGEPLPDLAALSSSDIEMQISILEKVESRFVDEAREYVIGIVQSAREARLLAAAIRALAAIGQAGDFQHFKHCLEHPDESVRLAAIEACGQLGSPRDILTWLTPVLRLDDGRTREAAVRMLLRFRPQVLIRHFRQLLAARRRDVRICGIYALASFSGDVIGKLLQPLAGDDDRQIRLHLARAAARRKEPWSLLLLERLCNDEDDEVAAEAARSKAVIKGISSAAGKRPEGEAFASAGAPAGRSDGGGASADVGRREVSVSSAAGGGRAADEGTGGTAPITPVHTEEAERAVQVEVSGRGGARPSALAGDFDEPPPEAEAAHDVTEDDMMSKSFVGNLASLANLSASSTLSTLFGRLSAKKHSTLKELSELDKRQRKVYESMGKKIYELAERGNIDDKEYRNSVFVIRKYLKLKAERSRKQDEKKTGSFLASLLGGGDGSGDGKDIEVTIRQQYVYLGKTACRLNREQGRFIEELREHYLDVEALEERIAELMSEEDA